MRSSRSLVASSMADIAAARASVARVLASLRSPFKAARAASILPRAWASFSPGPALTHNFMPPVPLASSMEDTASSSLSMAATLAAASGTSTSISDFARSYRLACMESTVLNRTSVALVGALPELALGCTMAKRTPLPLPFTFFVGAGTSSIALSTSASSMEDTAPLRCSSAVRRALSALKASPLPPRSSGMPWIPTVAGASEAAGAADGTVAPLLAASAEASALNSISAGPGRLSSSPFVCSIATIAAARASVADMPTRALSR
mmetsp:Transcript_53536/g.138386  ORF Transcript_53536/g.138386 Transcript_53536/m.138386 type:complete len:264 (-) Transcript_53536:1649-2440(-)